MPDYVSEAVRRAVMARANHRCEYCLLPAKWLLAGCEVDHIISRKHRGVTELSNLALSCARCNRAKGTDVGAISQSTGSFTRLFNPRTDIWKDHFTIQNAVIRPLTEIAEATVALLRLNDPERVLE